MIMFYDYMDMDYTYRMNVLLLSTRINHKVTRITNNINKYYYNTEIIIIIIIKYFGTKNISQKSKILLSEQHLKLIQ